MHTFSIGETLRAAWHIYTKRPVFLSAILLVTIVISSVVSSIQSSTTGLTSFVLTLASIAVGVLIEMGIVTSFLKAHEAPEKVTINDLWNPKMFWSYLLTKFAVGVMVVIGIILLVIPGIIIALASMFATFLVIDKGLPPVEAIKESWRMTRGHRLQLFLLVLTFIAMNILGAMALFVGLLVSVPLTLISIVHVYRSLGDAHKTVATSQ